MKHTRTHPGQVRLLHSWFTSGNYSLLGHLHTPDRGKFDLAVLIVPPFGWEDACSYRPLRALAAELAGKGIPAFRFDLPGTGDSSGTPMDGALMAAWIQSIADAAGELRRLTGVTEVAVVGVRLGAMLTVAAATQGANIQDLVLWAPYATGRAMLRELRAFRNLEVPEYASGESTSVRQPHEPLDDANLEVGGYVLSAETQQALENLDLAAALAEDPAQRRPHRVLLLSRDKVPADAKLTRAMAGALWPTDSEAGLGFGGMTSPPHEAAAPLETFKRIREWLTFPRKAIDGSTHALPLGVTNGYAETGSLTGERVELIRQTAAADESLAEGTGANFAVLTLPERRIDRVRSEAHQGELRRGALLRGEPAKRPDRLRHYTSDLCLLFLNAGAMRHVGPNRMWVDAARRWAARGVPSLRLDLRGIGESDGEEKLDVSSLYRESLTLQVENAIAHLRERLGVRRFLAVGLCSGAFLAFHAAVRNPAVEGALLLNPRLFFWDPEVDRRREQRQSSAALRNSDAWWRFLQGQLEVKRLKSVAKNVLQSRPAHPYPQVPALQLDQALKQISKHGARLTMVFTEGEPLLRELDEEGHLPGPFQCIRIANAGHTMRPLWAQREVHKLLDREVDALLRSPSAGPLVSNALAPDRSQ